MWLHLIYNTIFYIIILIISVVNLMYIFNVFLSCINVSILESDREKKRKREYHIIYDACNFQDFPLIMLAINAAVPASPIPHIPSMYANLSSELYFEIVINERDRFLHMKARSYSLLSVFQQKKILDTIVTFYCHLRGENVLRGIKLIYNFLWQ